MLYRVNEAKKILHKIEIGNANWISHISHGNRLLKLDNKGKM